MRSGARPTRRAHGSRAVARSRAIGARWKASRPRSRVRLPRRAPTNVRRREGSPWRSRGSRANLTAMSARPNLVQTLALTALGVVALVAARSPAIAGAALAIALVALALEWR